MPIYEFRCERCRRRSSVFTRSIGGAGEAVLRSEDDAFAGLDESSLGDVDENDPRSMARWLRRMSRQMGEPLDAEMEADLGRMEAGETPDGFGDGGEEAG